MASIPLAMLGGALALGGERINKRGLIRKTAMPDSAIHKQDELLNALDSYVNRVSPNNPIKEFNLSQPTPAEIDAANSPRGNLRQMASSGTIDGVPSVQMNMNAPAPMFAHELGHVAFGQTKFGNAVQDARAAMKNNPRLRHALLGATALAPAAAAALTPGDEDLLASVGLSLALDSPALIDEFEANRRSLALMNDAGVSMRPKDRARMAGAFLSYLGKPLALAASGNLAGNLIDQDV